MCIEEVVSDESILRQRGDKLGSYKYREEQIEFYLHNDYLYTVVDGCIDTHEKWEG